MCVCVSSHFFFSTGFPPRSLFGLKLLCRADGDRGEVEGKEEEGYPKRVGVKNLIALISVLAAHPFS